MANHTTAPDVAFEAVAEEVFRRYGRAWKPRTAKVDRAYLRNQILPWFRGRPIADITCRDVQRWFAPLHSTPAAANRSLPILSVIRPWRRHLPQRTPRRLAEGDTVDGAPLLPGFRLPVEEIFTL